MKSVWTISLLVFVFAACENANNMEDPNKKYFTRLIGENLDQWGVDLVVAPDGSMVLLGNTETSAHGQQLYVVRTTPEGYVMWTRRLGEVDPGNNAGAIDDEAKDIELMIDGGVALLAMKEEAGDRNFMIRLMDLNGNMTDSTEYGVAGFTEEASTITEISNGFIVSGYTTNLSTTDPADGMFVRFYKHLAVFPSASEPPGTAWDVSHGTDASFDVAVRTIEVGSKFYVFGHTNSDQQSLVGDYNPFVWILGSTGVPGGSQFTIDDSYIPGSFPGGDDIVSSVSTVQAGSGYIISGYSIDRLANEQKMFTIRIRNNIDNVDNNDLPLILAGERADDDSNSPVTTTSQGAVFSSSAGGFFVLGCKSVTNEDIYLKKLGSDLTDAWTMAPFFSFGGVGNDLPGAVAETSDGRIVLLGTMVLGDGTQTSQRKMVLMKLSPNGKLGE